MNGDPEQTSDVAPAPVAAAAETFACVECGRQFASATALQTHQIRAHKKFWSTKGPSKPKPSSYEKYRDRYRAQGLNARGEPYKNGPPKRVAAKAGPKPKHLTTTCPVCKQTY